MGGLSVTGGGILQVLVTQMGMEPILLPLQAGRLMDVLAQPAWIKALSAFVLVFGIGAVILLRHRSLISDSVTATIERPGVSIFYGMGAHVAVGFLGLYLGDYIGRAVLPGEQATLYGAAVTLGLGMVIGAWGFTVIGMSISEAVLQSSDIGGLATGALIAGVIAVFEPLIAVGLWVIIVSVSIGGRIRVWVHATEAEAP